MTTGIFPTLVIAGAALHIGAGCINWRHDSAGGRVRLLTGMYYAGGEFVLAHVEYSFQIRFAQLNIFDFRITIFDCHSTRITQSKIANQNSKILYLSALRRR